MTYCTPTPDLLPPALPRQAHTTPEVFGVLFAEIITPDGSSHLPDLCADLSGWELRSWPIARLGDATLEARPLYPHLNADHLRQDLENAGIIVLGPLREKR